MLLTSIDSVIFFIHTFFGSCREILISDVQGVLVDGKPTYAELEQRVRELEEHCSSLSANVDSLVVDVPAGGALSGRVKAPVVSGPGEVVGLPGIFQDDAARARAEAELARHHAGLEKIVAGRSADLEKTNELLMGYIARGRGLEEGLRWSEKHCRELVEGIDDLITQVDSQGRFLFVNHVALRIFGLAPEGCIGLMAFDFVHPEDRLETQRAFQGWLREHREVVVWENRQLGRNGQVHFLRWTCNFHYDTSGEILYINSIARDMTALHKAQAALRQANDEQQKKIAEQTRELEEKVAELVEANENLMEMDAELRESDERFRQIAENINSLFWIRDLSGSRILYVSTAYETIWGRSREGLYRDPSSWLDAVHHEDIDRVRANHLRPDSPAQVLEYRIIRSDGAIRWIRSKVFVVRDRTGRQYREVGIAEDITAYMEILDRLRESESRYRMLFETSTDGISVYALSDGNRMQKLIDCNASYLELTGRDKSELLDLADIRILKKFMDRTRGREGRSPSLGFLGDGRCSGLYSWVRPDGRTNFIECRGSRLFLNGREFMHCVHRDITQAKFAEEKIRRLSRRMIEVVEEEQKRIARDLHDEFGQRLLSIRHNVDDLQKKLVSAGRPDFPELAEIDGLIDTIGSAVRSATNKLRPDLLDTLGFLPALEWGMRDFADRYPSTRISMEVVGARRKIMPEFEIVLYRVFQEGLTNIGKHAGANTVSVRLIFNYPSFILVLADDGLGFDQDSLSGLPLETHGGIGLRSMKERVRAIGGTLSVRSRRGGETVLRAQVFQPAGGAEGLPLFHDGRERSCGVAP